MKKYTLLVLLSLLLGSQIAVAQDHVTNIRAKQNDKMVTITYDLNLRSNVRLFISLDDGQTYTDTMKVTGMVNRIVPAGKNKVIRWQAFNDLGYSDYPEIRFKFVTKEAQQTQQVPKVKQIPKRTFVTLDVANYLHGPYITSLGFTAGQVKKFGWFASVMGSFNIAFGPNPWMKQGFNFVGLNPDAVCDVNGYVEVFDDEQMEPEIVLPFYDDEYTYTTLSIMGGGIMRLNNVMYLKAGLGYGHRSLSWKTTDGLWVRNKAYLSRGVDVSLGMMFNFKHFVLSLDAVSYKRPRMNEASNINHVINRGLFEAKIGMGYSF